MLYPGAMTHLFAFSMRPTAGWVSPGNPSGPRRASPEGENKTGAPGGSGCRAWMRAICGWLLLLLLPARALADGMVFPPTAFPAHIPIPDQQALIHFTNDTERLVIETRFTAAGTNFAWVVPLPSRPVVEAASTGLFPTLRYLFQPRVIHNVPHYYLGILAAIAVALLIRAAGRSCFWRGVSVFLGILCLALLLLPALAIKTRTLGDGSAATPAQAVSILDRRVVGVFDTTTIASQDPKALQNWLRENKFVVAADSDPVIASYVKEGWVFVAAKLRRDLPDLQTSMPHPLSFTFKTARPVYPMRLTGLGNGPLRVELYVFGPSRATAPHFKVERCTRPCYPPPSDGWARTSPEPPNIVHPLLRQWVGGAPVTTKLTATLKPAHMRQDVWLDWGFFREKQSRLFSQEGARTYALNWGAGVFAAGLLFAWLASLRSQIVRRRLLTLSTGATVLGLALAGALYCALPTTKVRLVRRPATDTYNNLYYPYFFLGDETNLTAATARAILANPTNSISAQSWTNYFRGGHWDNHLLGGQVREEDSPGNYTFRETTGGLGYVTYDAQGADHVLGWLPR
jgi:Uncharacterized protein conserved in bacteria (DUF2330)